MRPFHLRLAAKSWLRQHRRSARFRLTALYGGVFLGSGAALLAATYALFERATEYKTPHLPRVPHTPNLQFLQPHFAKALLGAEYAQHQLAFALPNLRNVGLLPVAGHALTELDRAEHQLALAARQLAKAVHQIVQTGSVEAAQRAADSHQLLVNSGIALAIVAALALLAGWLLAGRMLRPIRSITRTARRISSSNLHERLALAGPNDELKELGDTLDELFGRLEAAFEAQRHFVANASHELRTPLTRERTLVQVALGDPSTSQVWRTTGQELLASNRQQEALIDSLLTLASSEGGLDGRERADLAEICETVLARPDVDFDRTALHVEIALHSAPFDGDPRLVERLVANLIDNAIGHNTVDGHVQIETGMKDGKSVLSVVNTGPVVPSSELDRLFQPFQRLDSRRTRDRNGHGLGLAIVRAIAAAHGAAVIASAPPAGGLAIDVAFPAPTVSDALRVVPLGSR
jgi:signal transduction histidine kinase